MKPFTFLGRKHTNEWKVRQSTRQMGRKLSVETRNKISLANKGKFFTDEIRKKISNAVAGEKNGFFGKKHTAETKLKISQSRMGKAVGNANGSKKLEVRKKISLSKMGANSPFWKGGVSKLYNVIRHTFEYRQWRSDVFQRDNYTCVFCGKKSTGDIQADHIKQFALILRENFILTVEDAIKCDELWNINNGRTLCEKCHSETESYLKKL
jgi:hypothetical protein